MKTSKKILIGVGVFLLLLLITWGICETAGADYYNYSGHVIDIAEENGDTVITTLCGKTESRFILKWYSREKYKKDTKDVQVGDYIMLSTTQYSNTNIKKMSVDYGYSTDGKLVWINEFTDRPHILATDPTTNLYYFFDFSIGVQHSRENREKATCFTLSGTTQKNVQLLEQKYKISGWTELENRAKGI